MSMIVRKAKPSDIPAIVEIAVDSVSRDPFPVRIDRSAMAQAAKETMGPAHFMWVTEVDGKVVAAFAAQVASSFWHERLACSVLLYNTLVPGAGLPLFREFVKWVKSRPAIKVAIFELEPGADPRLVDFLKRSGFSRQSQNLTYVRGLT